MSSTGFSLSLYDLIQIDKFKQAIKDGDQKKAEEVLHENGLAVGLGYEQVVCTHRCLTRKEPWYGVRYEGSERTDKEFLATGSASLDAHIASSGDMTLRKELKNMSKTSESVSTNEFKEWGEED
jgi:hypothetical protein